MGLNGFAPSQMDLNGFFPSRKVCAESEPNRPGPKWHGDGDEIVMVTESEGCLFGVIN